MYWKSLLLAILLVTTTFPQAAAGDREPRPLVAIAREEPLVQPALWPQPLDIRFTWPQDTAAAAFLLDGRAYLLFDREADPDLAARLAQLAPELAELERLPLPGGTLLRFRPPPLAEPRLTRTEKSWHVDLRVQPLPPTESNLLSEEVEPFLKAVAQSRHLFSLPDPLGGELYVLPLPRAGNGLASALRLPGFELLPTAQGLLLRRLADAVPQQRILRMPKGERDALPRHPAGPSRAWPEAGLDHSALRRELEARLIAAPPREQAIARVALARMYLSQGLMAEAQGLFEDMPADLRDPEVLLLTAMARLLRGELSGVAKLLAAPALQEDAEARTWQGLLAAKVGDWPVAAARLAEDEAAIESYPRPLRLELRLAAAEARIAVGDPAGAALLLEAAETDSVSRGELARLDLLRGHMALASGAAEEGLRIWRELAARDAGFASAAARLALMERGLAEGHLSRASVLDGLERLRLAWHGDAFEADLLLRLSELYLADSRPREALRRLKQLASHFPDYPPAATATNDMRRIFADSFLGAEAERLSPLVALALYEEFRELMPPGPEGRKLILALSERLISVDLLERAASLLEELLAGERLAGDLRAHAGARLAELQLARRAPAVALAVLESTGESDLDPAIVTWRQRIAARALAELGRKEEALAALAGQQGREVEELRLTLLWRDGDWSGAARVLTRLLPSPPTAATAPAPAVSRRVLDLAVALTLAREEERLSNLRAAWGPAMALGPDAEAFMLVAGERQGAEAVSIAAELARAERALGFMAAYRARKNP